MPVWAWFSASGAGDFVRIEGKLTAVKYVRILQDVLLPSAQARFPGRRVKFIQDLSPIHTARVVQAWFRQHPEIELLPWPPKGADMNPIENVWGDIVKDLEYIFVQILQTKYGKRCLGFGIVTEENTIIGEN